MWICHCDSHARRQSRVSHRPLAVSKILKADARDRPTVSDVLGIVKGYISGGQVGSESGWQRLSVQVSSELGKTSA